MVQKTSAWPLALVYAVLIVFASLFPFDGWRAQGIDPLVFLTAKIPPPYWTWFDININIVGYAPLGFFLALALVPIAIAIMVIDLPRVLFAVGVVYALSGPCYWVWQRTRKTVEPNA